MTEERTGENAERRDRRISSRIVSNATWLTGGRIFTLVVGTGVVLIAARYLGPTEFGRYSYAVALVLLFAEVADLGLRGIITRDLVAQPSSRDEILGSAFVVRITGGAAAVGMVLGSISVLRPGDSELQLMVLILSAGVILQPMRIVDLFYESELRSRYTVLSDAVATAVWFGLVALVVPFGYGSTWLSGAKGVHIGLGALILIAVFARQGWQPLRWRFELTRARLMLRQSWPLAISSIGVAIYLKIDQVMLGEMLGDREVGIYAIAAQLSEASYFLPAVIASSIFPSLVLLKKTDEIAYGRRLQRSFNFLAWFAIATSILVVWFADDVVELVFGDEYGASAVILSVHIWASVFVYMRTVLSRWLIIEELYVFSLVTHGAGALVNVLANLLLIPPLKGVGAAIATVVSYATASYFALFFHRSTKDAGVMMTKALAWPFLQLSSWVTRSKSGRNDLEG